MDLKKYKKRFMESYQLKQSKNGNYLARNDGEKVYLYDLNKDCLEIAVFEDLNYVQEICFSDNEEMLALKSIEPKVAIYNMETKTMILEIEISNANPTQEGKFCFSKDHKYLLSIIQLNGLIESFVVIDLIKKSYKIIFQLEQFRFYEIIYVSWRDIYIVLAKDIKKGKTFVFEYNSKKNNYKRIQLSFDFSLIYPLAQLQRFLCVINNKIYIIKGNYKTVLASFSPIDNTQKTLNYFDIVSDSPSLQKMFENEEELNQLKESIDDDLLNVSVEGNIEIITLSHDLKYLAVATNDVIKLFMFQGFELIKTIKIYNISDLSFSFNNKLLLIGTWNYGYIYSIEDILK